MQERTRDYRLATLMFEGGRPQDDLIALQEAVQYGLFSIRGNYRRFVRSQMTIDENGLITADAKRTFRWDPDLTQRPRGRNAHVKYLSGLFMGPEWEQEHRALRQMDDFDFHSTPYTGIVPVYVENSDMLPIDRQQLYRALGHALNGRIAFTPDLNDFPEVCDRLNAAPKPFRDMTAVECAAQNDDAIEVMMMQLLDQHSLVWQDHFQLAPAQWLEPVPKDALVFVRRAQPYCFPAASPSQLRIKRGALNLVFGSPPQARHAEK